MSPTELILVAIMPSQRDLEIARVLGWYRIPYARAPKTVAVDRVAFYQTARFGDEKWSIRYTAPVLGHELVTRAELLRTEAGHPRAGEQYFKLQLGPLEALERPIPSLKWRRISFLYTTGERLLKATEINDLIVDGEERQMLWTALKERGLPAEPAYESRGGMQLDFAILYALGNLGIVIDGPKTGTGRKLKDRGRWKYRVVPEESVRGDADGVAAKISAAVKRLGGPAR